MCLRREAVDLIQKQSTALGLTDQPRLITRGASERSAFMAEELAFGEVFWKRTAINWNEWPPCPRT